MVLLKDVRGIIYDYVFRDIDKIKSFANTIYDDQIERGYISADYIPRGHFIETFTQKYIDQYGTDFSLKGLLRALYAKGSTGSYPWGVSYKYPGQAVDELYVGSLPKGFQAYLEQEDEWYMVDSFLSEELEKRFLPGILAIDINDFTDLMHDHQNRELAESYFPELKDVNKGDSIPGQGLKLTPVPVIV